MIKNDSELRIAVKKRTELKKVLDAATFFCLFGGMAIILVTSYYPNVPTQELNWLFMVGGFIFAFGALIMFFLHFQIYWDAYSVKKDRRKEIILSGIKIRTFLYVSFFCPNHVNHANHAKRNI